MRYLALGDSYTVGEGTGKGESFPALVDRLWSTVNGRRSTVDLLAATGWTTGDLLAAIHSAPPAGTYDLVTLCIGVNNQYRGLPVGQFRAEFGELLDLAIRYAGGEPDRVLALSIPDWGVTPFAEGRDRTVIAGEIDLFNREAASAARARGAGWLDVTGDSRAHPADVVGDGLHPSAAAYRRWAQLVVQQLQP